MISSELNNLIHTGRLTITQGRPLSNEEINLRYSESLVVWNAYERTMQSGVLAKAFMFGTPVIVLKKNLMQELQECNAVVTIDNNKSFEQITIAIKTILNSGNAINAACRECFERLFYYKEYTAIMDAILQD